MKNNTIDQVLEITQKLKFKSFNEFIKENLELSIKENTFSFLLRGTLFFTTKVHFCFAIYTYMLLVM